MGTLKEQNFEDLTTCGEEQIFFEECGECDDCTSRGLDNIVGSIVDLKEAILKNLTERLNSLEANIQNFKDAFSELWVYVAKLKPGIPPEGAMVNWSSKTPNMGQVLMKTSDLDYDVGWRTIPCPFPVHSIFITVEDINPSNYWTGTRWERFAQGRTMFGYSQSDSDFSAGKQGGTKVLGLVSHSHSFSPSQVVIDVPWYNGATKVGAKASRLMNNGTKQATSVGSNGNVSSNNNANLPPYITTYMWKRLPDEE